MIEWRLRDIVKISERQYGFQNGKSTTVNVLLADPTGKI